MSESNLKLREKAVPFIAWHQLKSSALTSTFRLYTCPLISRANLIEAYLTLFSPVDSAVSVQVAIGEFQASGVEPVLSYSDAYIAESHKKITGLSSPIASSGGMLMIDGANLLHEANKFSEHGFVLMLKFSRALGTQEGFLIDEKLMVNCSAEMGLI